MQIRARVPPLLLLGCLVRLPVTSHRQEHEDMPSRALVWILICIGSMIGGLIPEVWALECSPIHHGSSVALAHWQDYGLRTKFSFYINARADFQIDIAPIL